MNCENVKCPYYRKPPRRDWVDKMIGTTRKSGGCDKPYCKLSSKRK